MFHVASEDEIRSVSTFRSGACLSIGYIVRRRVEFQLVKSSLFQQVQLVYVVSAANKAELMLIWCCLLCTQSQQWLYCDHFVP